MDEPLFRREARVHWKDNHAELAAVLDDARRIGVPVANTRFAHYLARLETLGTAASVPSMPLDQSVEVMWEATTQAQLLRMSRPAWQDGNAGCRALLKRAMKGMVFTPRGRRDDPGRNALLELFVIALLRNAGHEVTTDPDGADATVATSGETFVVECKRPASARSFADNVDDACRQIGRRRHGLGLIVIGTDRVLDFKGAVPSDTKGALHLCDTLLDPLEEQAERRFARVRLTKRIALLLVHSGAVYVQYPTSAPFTFVQMRSRLITAGTELLRKIIVDAYGKMAVGGRPD